MIPRDTECRCSHVLFLIDRFGLDLDFTGCEIRDVGSVREGGKAQSNDLKETKFEKPRTLIL